MRAQFSILADNYDYILLEDHANSIDSMSITNDAENVIEFLDAEHKLSNTKIVYYIDTDGRVDILSHKNGVFTGFKFGYGSLQDFKQSVKD